MTVGVLTVITGALYCVAAVFSAIQLRSKTAWFQSASRIFLFAGLLMHSIAIGINSVSTDGTLLQGPNILMLMSWMFAVVVTFLELASKRSFSYGAFTIPIIVVLLVVYGCMELMDNGVALYNRVYNEWPLLVIHIIVMLVAFACFMVSAVVSIMYLYQLANVKRKSDALLKTKMPALETLKRVAGIAIVIGLPFFTIGILTGFSRYAVLIGVSMTVSQAHLLYLSPRILLSLIVFFAYSLYVVLKYLIPGKVSAAHLAWISVIAGVLTLVLTIISSMVVV